MAIATIGTLSTSKYRGGAGLAAADGLVADLNTLQGKVDEIIGGIGTSDTLTVGDVVNDSTYYSGTGSWFYVDGTNPPTMEKFRLLDQTTGLFVTVTASGGALAVS